MSDAVNAADGRTSEDIKHVDDDSAEYCNVLKLQTTELTAFPSRLLCPTKATPL